MMMDKGKMMMDKGKLMIEGKMNEGTMMQNARR